MRVRLVTGLIAIALGGACITPSIPIPPPEPSAMTFMVNPIDGVATFRYAPQERFSLAKVYVFNKDQGAGIITTANINGGVPETAPFPAIIGDEVVITFEVPEDTVSSCVRVTDGTPNALDVCN